MNCTSGIYTINNTSTTVNAGGAIPFTNIVRRYGCAVNLNGNAVTIRSNGYYDVDVNINLTPTATGNLTATLYVDGVAVPGATSTIAATATDATSININAIVRKTCSVQASTLTVVLTQDATVTNAGMVVERI